LYGKVQKVRFRVEANSRKTSSLSSLQILQMDRRKEKEMEGKVISIITIAIKYNTHVRPYEIHFRHEVDGFVYAYHMGGYTGSGDPTYGTHIDKIGESSYCGERNKERSCSYSVSDYESSFFHRKECKSAAMYYILPAYGCVHCGNLSVIDKENINIHVLLRKYSCGSATSFGFRRIEKFTLLGYTALIAELNKINKKHPVLLYRCSYCKKKYKGLYGHLVDKATNKSWCRDGFREDMERKAAIKYLESIGKSVKKARTQEEKINAKKAIRRRLRKRFNKLSKGELQFFQMMAGANAIKTMGGLHGSEYRTNKVA